MAFTVVITGDIGAGKSTLASLWNSMGASTVSADNIVQSLWEEDEELRSQALERWGGDIFDALGNLRRDLIMERAFKDEQEYSCLCNLIHPKVKRVLDRFYHSSGGWLVAEIPLLFESGVPWWSDVTMYLSSLWENRVERNLHRGKSREWLQKMESHLMPSEKRKKLSDMLLENDGSLNEFLQRAQVLGERFSAFSRVVEVQGNCSSMEIAEQITRMLRSHRLGVFFSLREVYNFRDNGRIELTWFTLENHFLRIQSILQEKCETRIMALRMIPCRRMDVALLEQVTENCR